MRASAPFLGCPPFPLETPPHPIFTLDSRVLCSSLVGQVGAILSRAAIGPPRYLNTFIFNSKDPIFCIHPFLSALENAVRGYDRLVRKTKSHTQVKKKKIQLSRRHVTVDCAWQMALGQIPSEKRYNHELSRYVAPTTDPGRQRISQRRQSTSSAIYQRGKRGVVAREKFVVTFLKSLCVKSGRIHSDVFILKELVPKFFKANFT